jgi:predicted choloylglycine hydrolase
MPSRIATALPCLVWVLLGAPARAEEAFRFPPGKLHDKAELKYVGNVPVLQVAGSPEEIGAAVGSLALKPGVRVLGYPRELLQLRKVEGLWNYFKGAGKALYKQFPDQSRDELEGLVKGAGADRDLVIAGNTFFDLKKVVLCSAVLIEKPRSATGGPQLARNLDYPSLGYIHHYSLVTVYRPKGKLAFAAVGFPGLVGVLSGMNEAGLCLGVLEVFDTKEGETHFDNKGVPYGLCLRRALEEARTIDEAKKVLESLRRTTTINVAIADTKEVAVLEVSPSRVVKRSGAEGVCVTTNHFCSDAQKCARPVNIDRTFERFARLEQVKKDGDRLTPDDLRKHLDAVNLGTLTLQTMVFEPAALRLHLAIGGVPASKMKLQPIDLGPLLRPEADRR